MSKLQGLTLKQTDVSQIIDLNEVFGVDLSEHSDIKERFAQACIDHVVERTGKGIDVHGRKFDGPYDPEYVESQEFAAYGKQKSKVNMNLRGEMLGLLDVLSTRGNGIKIGWDEALQNKKAFNHNTGDTVPKREFFGLNRAQLESVGAPFLDEIKKLDQKTVDDDTVAALSALEIFKKVKSSEDAAANQKLLEMMFGGGVE